MIESSLYIDEQLNLTEKKIHSSERIRAFLETVTPGKQLGFVDMDQCIWQAGVDGEEIAFEKFGLIADKPAWHADLASVKVKGGDAHLVEGRPINLAHYPSSVTPEIASHTGIPVGETMSPSVIRALGTAVGNYIVTNKLYRPEAMRALEECEEQNISLAFITATPVDLAQGIYDSVRAGLAEQETYHLPHATILGTEDIYDTNGRVRESLFIYGDTKSDIVKAAQERGGVAVLGAGDKFETSDAFVALCRIRGNINNKAVDKGNAGWNQVNDRLAFQKIDPTPIFISKSSRR